MNSLFASTARGLEELLKTELENLGAVECQVVQGGVHFKGDTRLVYQSLMWSRLASRIMLPLGECKVYSDLDLYLGVQAINWTEMFNPGATFAVHFSGLNDTIRNSQYGAMKVKDAIVDAFTRKNLPRPNVDRDAPDIRVNVWLHKETASIALDLSGDGLSAWLSRSCWYCADQRNPGSRYCDAIRLAARNTAARSDVWFRYVAD